MGLYKRFIEFFKSIFRRGDTKKVAFPQPQFNEKERSTPPVNSFSDSDTLSHSKSYESNGVLDNDAFNRYEESKARNSFPDSDYDEIRNFKPGK